MQHMCGLLILDANFLLTAIAGLLAFVIAYQYLVTFRFWSSRGVRGPFPWPFVGTNIYYVFKKKIELDNEMHAKYGKTYGIYEGTQPALRTIDNEVIKQVFIKDFSNFTDRNTKLVVGELRRWLLFSTGQFWSNQRALITPLFTSGRMRHMFKSMVGCAERYLAMVAKQNLTQFSDGTNGILLSKDELMSLSLDVIATTFFGLKLDTYRDKTSEFFRKAFAFARFEVVRFFVWICTPSSLAVLFNFNLIGRSKYEYFDKLSQQMIEARRKPKEVSFGETSSKSVDMISALLEAKLPEETAGIHTAEDNLISHYNNSIEHQELDRIHKEQSKRVEFKRFDDAAIRGHATFFFLAGFDTTSLSLALCLYELGHQQEAQAELYAELLGANVGGSLNAPEDDEYYNLEYSKLMGLKKLDAFISETLRLWPPVTEIARTSTNEDGVSLVIDDKTIIHLPADVGISISPYQLHRHPDYWLEPDKFDMSRFYPENRSNLISCAYTPFGLGPRNCGGMRFALMNLKCALSKVLLNYQVKSGPNTNKYPPSFKFNPFFNDLEHTDFILVSRH